MHIYINNKIGQGAGLYNVSSDKLNLVNPFTSSGVTGYPTSNGKQRNQVRLFMYMHIYLFIYIWMRLYVYVFICVHTYESIHVVWLD
jgi:hypothetical protein